MEAGPTLSKTVCLKSPAAYLASVRAKALARSVSPIAVFVSTIFFRICLQLSQCPCRVGLRTLFCLPAQLHVEHPFPFSLHKSQYVPSLL